MCYIVSNYVMVKFLLLYFVKKTHIIWITASNGYNYEIRLRSLLKCKVFLIFYTIIAGFSTRSTHIFQVYTNTFMRYHNCFHIFQSPHCLVMGGHGCVSPMFILVLFLGLEFYHLRSHKRRLSDL